jgi:hypothetical protein
MLTIQMTKRADGAGVLRCTRADGSVTWQKQTERHAAFFALHDLTHFAVESVLGFRGGFYGLIAAGWDIEDTTGKGARGPLPPEAVEVERIVGFFDTERGSGAFLTAEDYALFASPDMRRLSAEEILRVRARRGGLFSQWAAVAPGEALELRFAD